MKRIGIICLLFLASGSILAAGPEETGRKQSFRGGDATSIDAIVSALYASVSSEAGVEKDWTRLRALFAEGARLMPVVWRGEDDVMLRQMSVDEYITRATEYFKKNSFYEREIGRSVDEFGNMAQVFSSYESYHSKSDPVPFARGINSIQLYYDGRRWWVVSVAWVQERDGLPIPERYLHMPE